MAQSAVQPGARRGRGKDQTLLSEDPRNSKRMSTSKGSEDIADKKVCITTAVTFPTQAKANQRTSKRSRAKGEHEGGLLYVCDYGGAFLHGWLLVLASALVVMAHHLQLLPFHTPVCALSLPSASWFDARMNKEQRALVLGA